MAESSGEVVKLNVYDLSEQNFLLYWLGFGVFHTGVEVFGVEYAFGGHEYDASGIFATEPCKPPGPVEFRKSITLGETKLSPDEVQHLVAKMGEQFKGNRYHLLQRNCNHFSSELCKELVGRRAPKWINRLAGLAVMCHCLIPATWVPPLNTPTSTHMENIEERNEVPPWTGEIAAAFQFHKDSQRLLYNSGVRSDEYPVGDTLCDTDMDVGLEAHRDYSGSDQSSTDILHFLEQ